MRYKTVKRVVTIEFVKERRGNGYEVLITPEKVVARYKDTVEWNVQGLPPGLMKTIDIGHFVRRAAPRHVKHGKRGLAADNPAGPKGTVKAKSAGGVVTLSLDLGNAAPGRYEYDVLNDGKTLLDPEIEIRGPRA